jgi:HSP20 family protein
MNRLFDWAFGRHGGEGTYGSDWMPAVDVYEEGDSFHIRADLPGLKRDDIDITVDGNTLTISGEKKHEKETKEDSYYRAERFYGKFSRSVDMPSTVDTTKIEAKYKDGVLEIALPKSETARPKQIKIS